MTPHPGGGGAAAGVTVAVASCGRPRSLARCLDALAGGGVLPGELIVVEQAPSPEGRAAVEAFDAAPVRYFEQARAGLSASRNLALAHAGGALLAVTDDDCAPQAGWVAAIAAAFARAPSPAAVTGPIVALGERPAGGHAVSLREAFEPRELRGRMPPWDAGSGANFAAPTTLLRELGGWDERLGAGTPGHAAEDADLLYRILRAGGTVRYDPGVVVGHDWQTWARRLQTRTSYAHGIGALCALWLARGDAYALRMLAAYARPHCRALLTAARRRDRAAAAQHGRALGGLLPGLGYGLAAARRPAERAP
jgi:GT2 family glycosyltransferase